MEEEVVAAYWMKAKSARCLSQTWSKVTGYREGRWGSVSSGRQVGVQRSHIAGGEAGTRDICTRRH